MKCLNIGLAALALLIMAGGISLSVFLFKSVRSNDYQQALNQLNGICNTKAAETELNFRVAMTMLDTLDQFTNNFALPTPAQWQTHCSALFNHTQWSVASLAQGVLLNGAKEAQKWQISNNVTIKDYDEDTGKLSVSNLTRAEYMPTFNSYPRTSSRGVDILFSGARKIAIMKANRTRNIVVSKSIISSIKNVNGQNLRAFLIILPKFNQTSSLLTGSLIAGFFQYIVIPDRNKAAEAAYSLSIFDEMFSQDPEFESEGNGSIVSSAKFYFADASASLACSRKFSYSNTAIIVVTLGIFISIIIPLASLAFLHLYHKKKSVESKMFETKLETQAALESANIKTKFLSQVSHNLRWPLNGIINMNSFLSETSLDNQQSEYVQIIQSTANHLLDIINDILEFSRIENGKMTLEILTFDLHKLLTDIELLYKGFALENHNTFNVQRNIQCPCWIEADPHRLRQVISNLLSNALKFTSNGNVSIIVNALDSFLHFSIRDTGIGMSPETITKLFKPFEQGNVSVSRKFGGSGLGLVISQQFIHLMGGTITLKSEEEIGSCFDFTIPYIHGVPPVEVKMPMLDIKSDGFDETKSFNVLIVDDMLINQKVASKMIQKFGWNTTIVNDGQDVIDLYSSGNPQFDVILMDIQMVRLNGDEATKILRNMGVKIPIIAMTASVLPNDKDKFLASGLTDIVAKPVNFGELKRILFKHLVHSRSVD